MNEQATRGTGLSRLLVLLYATSGYLAFLAVFLVFIGWSVGVAVPWTIDGEALLFQAASPTAAVAVNLGLILLFGLQHSIMAREAFKVRLRRWLPRAAERATFVWVSNLMLALVIAAWQPLPGLLWQAQGTAATVLLAINGAGWLLLVASTYMVDHWDFNGMRQAWDYLRRRAPTPPPFMTRYAYRFVRHPMMTGLLIGLWVVPAMSWGHLVLSAGFTAYILVGTRFEERDLVRNLGEDYLRYRERVPMLVPRPGASVPNSQGKPAAASRD